MRRHSVITLGAAGTVAVLGLSAIPANAATATPARGSAKSALSLLQLQVGSKLIQAVNATGLASTLTSKVAEIAVTPVKIGSTAYGATTITPSSGSKTIAAPSAPALPGNLAQLASPVLTAAASLPLAGPLTSLGATSLGSAKILGLPLQVAGTLSQSASSAASSVGTTGLKLTNFALPSVNDLLGALGLDISALPVSTLNSLLTQLYLPTTGLSAANSAVASAQAAASSTIDRLRAATALLSTKQSNATTATAALTTATTVLTTALNTLSAPILTLAGLSSIPSVASYEALPAPVQSILTTAVPSIATADAAFTAAQSALATATGAVTTATALVTSLSNLGNLVKGILDATPLASIGSINMTAVSSAGKALSANVTGTVTGIKVMGTDVIKSLTGSSTIDAGKLVGSLAGQVQAVANSTLATLDSILSTVPGVGGLNLPLPTIKVLDIVKSAEKFANGSQDALAKVTALTVNIPAFSIPSALALPGAASLPGITSVVGGILNQAVKITVGTITEHSTFLPAGVTSTGTVVPSTPTGTKTGLASTGFNPMLALTALMLLGAGFGIRRFAKVSAEF